MIKGINSGYGVQVNGGYVSWPQFYNSSTASGNTLVGQLRYNGASQTMEVYNGASWLTMASSYPTVELAPEVQTVLNWARTKMAEEQRMRELAEKHPTVADAIAARERAEEAVRIAVALCDVK